MVAERLGAALQSDSLDWSSHQTRDIDFVTAAGMERPQLGILLIRAYVSNEPGAVKIATWLVTRKSRKWLPNLPEGMRRKLASAAVREFLLPLCPPCGGTGKTLHGQKWAACPTCQGSGTRHRHTDRERAQSIGVETMSQWDEAYNEILTRLNNAYRLALAGVGRRIGR